MIKEVFLGRKPSHFHMNAVVKAFIISEIFLWSSWNAIIPIFAIFAATQIPEGNTEIAAASFSTYLIVRVVFELISGKYLSHSSEMQKFIVTIIGIILMSGGYLGFALTKDILYFSIMVLLVRDWGLLLLQKILYFLHIWIRIKKLRSGVFMTDLCLWVWQWLPPSEDLWPIDMGLPFYFIWWQSRIY